MTPKSYGLSPYGDIVCRGENRLLKMCFTYIYGVGKMISNILIVDTKAGIRLVQKSELVSG